MGVVVGVVAVAGRPVASVAVAGVRTERSRQATGGARRTVGAGQYISTPCANAAAAHYLLSKQKTAPATWPTPRLCESIIVELRMQKPRPRRCVSVCVCGPSERCGWACRRGPGLLGERAAGVVCLQGPNLPVE